MEAKQWANAAPAGLVALAVAAYIFFGLFTGLADATCTPLMGWWLIGGFIVQVIVAVLELKAGAMTGGNVFTFFCAFFMFTSGAEMLYKFWASGAGVAIDSSIDGWAWLVLSISLVLWTAAYLRESPKVMSLVVLCLDPALVIVALVNLGVLGASVFEPIAGVCMLCGGSFAIYFAAALVVNNAYKRTVLPVGTPFVKEKPAE